jgi:hypothetical protein
MIDRIYLGQSFNQVRDVTLVAGQSRSNGVSVNRDAQEVSALLWICGGD